MTSLTQDLERVRQATGEDAVAVTRVLYRNSVMYLLQHDPFYGWTLSRLTLRLEEGATPIALTAAVSEWQVAVSPAAVSQTDWTGAQWLAMLRHTVLHLLWQHPTRYAQAVQTSAQAGLVRWATDAAVNDYLTDLPARAVTSRRLAAVMGQPVAPQQDSAVYLRQLRTWQANQRATDQQLAAGGPGHLPELPVQDGHTGWSAAADQDAATREQWRSDLFQSVNTALSAKQRGTLPGSIRAALTLIVATQPLDWQSLLKRGLGQVPAGRQPAYGRFNRRQPMRMELPGEIVQTWRKVAVFVDESGSMGNREVSYLLGQLTSLLAVYPAQVTVYPFDTVVDLTHSFTLERRPQRLIRTGGGGTRFQAVLDALPRIMAGNVGQLVIILTDGYGEQKLRPTLPATLVWLLTSPVSQFSVQQAPGTVVSLAADPQWQRLRRQK